MAITTLSLDTLTAQALAAFRVRFPTRSTHQESLLGKMAVALAGLIWSVHEKVQQADYDATPQGKSTYDALAMWAFVFGLPDGANGFGPKGATAATGLQGTITGTSASVVWNGAGSSPQLAANDGVTLFVLRSAATIGGAGSVTGVIFDAVTTGTAGNIAVGDTLGFVGSIAGVDHSVTITTASTNGTDKESASALLARILFRMQHGPKAITAADIREIAEGISGVERAYVYPLRHGAGSADLTITAPISAGGGTARDPGATVKTNVETAIAAARNITATINVYRPQFGTPVTIDARAVADADFPFDWADGGTPMTVKAGGTTTLLRINGSPPAALVTAAGLGQPRIQVANSTSGAPTIAEQVKVTHIDTATINPDTILTVSPALTIYPTAADNVYAGGAGVAYAQQAIKDYLNTLGPSKDSGYADSTDDWIDDVSVSSIILAVLDAEDESGSAVFSAIVFSGTTPQIKVNGAVQDYSPPDVSVSGPELAIAKLIVVRA